VAGETINLNSLQVGERAMMFVRCEARSGQQMTLGLHGAGARKHRDGFIVVQKATPPFTVAGEFDTLDPGDTPEQFKLMRVVFGVARGDNVLTTDGVYYTVRVVGSDLEGAQLPADHWSPSDALRPVLRFSDIERNFGPNPPP